MSDFQQTEVLMDMHDLLFLQKCVEMAEQLNVDDIFDARCSEMLERLSCAMERLSHE